MKLLIDFPKNLITDELLGQVKIPCLCKISDIFEVRFFDTVPESDGAIVDWDRNELELRAMPGTGGQYTHHAFSLITLEKIDQGSYRVIGLEMFYTTFGWCCVLADGKYAPPRNFWDEE